MSTPHLSAKPGDIADAILLPGDPLRARFIAETYLKDPICYNEVRGMYGYTGTFEGKRISVQGTGMGIPSASIYIDELINVYGVKDLIRIGTCGSLQEEVRIRDVVMAVTASTDSQINRIRFKGLDFAPCVSPDLMFSAWDIARRLAIPLKAGSVLTSDTFYHDDPGFWRLWADFGVLAAEMETAGLYTLAAKYHVRALSLLTVSDHVLTGESCSPEERQLSFGQMMELALRTLLEVS